MLLQFLKHIKKLMISNKAQAIIEATFFITFLVTILLCLELLKGATDENIKKYRFEKSNRHPSSFSLPKIKTRGW